MHECIAPKHIPYEEIITATEATARRLDQKSADALRLGVSAALQQAKPPQPNLSPQQRKYPVVSRSNTQPGYSVTL